MADPMRPAPPPGTTASPLFLREAELRRGIDLLLAGHAHLLRSIDAPLAERGLGRAHHRALHHIARHPGLTVGDLLRLLGITKQSLGRVLADLTERELIETSEGLRDRRRKLLRPTDAGRMLEATLSEALRAKLAEAYVGAGQNAVTGFWAVLDRLVAPEEKVWIASIGQRR